MDWKGKIADMCNDIAKKLKKEPEEKADIPMHLLHLLHQDEGPLGNLFRKFIEDVAEDVIDEVIVTDRKTMSTLGNVSGSAELRWRVTSERLSIHCPSCGSRVYPNCARVSCYKCGEVSMIKSQVLSDICKKCVSFGKECEGPLEEDDLQSPIVKLSKGKSKIKVPTIQYSED